MAFVIHVYDAPVTGITDCFLSCLFYVYLFSFSFPPMISIRIFLRSILVSDFDLTYDIFMLVSLTIYTFFMFAFFHLKLL